MPPVPAQKPSDAPFAVSNTGFLSVDLVWDLPISELGT